MEFMDINRVTLAVLFLLEVVIVILYWQTTTYSAEAVPGADVSSQTIGAFYPFFTDVHVMIFVGFGFLMTFLKRYGFSAVGFNFFVSCFMLQWSILVTNFFHMWFNDDFHEISLDIKSLIAGDFGAGSVMITMGAVLGRTTASQLILIGFVHIIFYALNETIGVVEFEAVDMGGSMFVHTYGAYFGLAASWMLTKRQGTAKEAKSSLNGSSYHSDLFAMIGTLFLWMYWPSFNGALASENGKHRVVINTVFALCGSCFMTFLTSKFLHGKFDMVDIQNATLAGGVAVGSSADLVIGPAGAIVIGAAGGLVSTLGYKYITPFLARKIGLYDTCGVHNLHGMPGIIGGIGGCISAASAGMHAYGEDIGAVFPARANDGRSAGSQGAYQLYTLLVTLGISISAGLIGGFLASLLPRQKEFFNDEEWLIEDEDDKEETVKENQSEFTSAV